jgi:deoxycytidine triphosphate deaminase
MLSDEQILSAIKGNSIEIDPFDRDFLGPNSYDISLSTKYRILETKLGSGNVKIDTTERVPLSFESAGVIELKGHQTAILMSREKITIRSPFAGILSPRSGFSCLPISIGYSHLIDTGYSGPLKATVTNNADYTLLFHEKQRFMQVMFHMVGPVSQNYQERVNSKYTLHGDNFEVPQYKIDKEWLKK